MKISTIIDSSKVLTKEEEKALFKEYYETPSSRRKREIKDTIVLAQSRHIISIAQIYRDKGDIEDLFQEGMIAVLEAFPNYDYTQAASFMTYTKQIIIRRMAKYLRRTKVMKISEQAINNLRKINKAKQLLERLKKPITTTEIAKLTNIQETTIISILNAISTVELNFGYIDMGILSPTEFATLNGLYIEDKTHAEIATELKLTEKQIRMTEVRAMRLIERQ